MRPLKLISGTFCLLLFAACGSDPAIGLDGGVACTTDAECPTGQVCDLAQNMCVPGTVKECTTDAECTAPKTCVSNQCEAPACTDHGDCGDFLCIDDVCAESPSCTADGDECPSGTECDVPNETCEVVPPCTDDGDCAGSDVCIAAECIAPPACTDTSECPEDLVCVDDVCERPCVTDDDCGSALMWSCESGECVQRCLGDGTCPQGDVCESGLCEPEECTTEADCPAANERCEDGGVHGRCVEFTPCVPGNNDCPDNFVCEVDECVELPRCINDRECGSDAYCADDHCQPGGDCSQMSCDAGFECIGDRCVPAGCRSLDDCPTAGDVCVGGECQTPPGPDLVIQVVILTPAGSVRPTDTYAFVAVAQDPSGNAIPGLTFDWNSTVSGVATIAANGVATGGATAGTTQITASVTNASGTITSAPVTLTNLGALTAGDVRITAVSQAGGNGVSGATVEATINGGTLTAMTDAQGVAVFTGASPTGPYSVTVASVAHDFVSLIDVTSPDLVVPLPSISRPDRVGGARGTVDFTQVTTQGAGDFSISGASFESPIFANAPVNILGGEQFNVEVMTPFGNFDIPLLAGWTFSAQVMGFPFDVKSEFYVRARPGTRSIWTIAGRADLDTFGGVGPGGGMTNILAAILPTLQRMDHAVRPVVPVLALPTVPDATDINGNGDTTELVPDFLNFPNTPTSPSVPQTLRYYFRGDSAPLPFVTGGIANTLIVISGTLLPSVGFVPLGFDGLEENNGLTPSFPTKMAPAHSGLEVGDYAVLVIATRFENNNVLGPGSARLFVETALPAEVDVSDGFLASPIGATYDPMNRELTRPTTAGTDLVHTVFRGADGGWHVYAPPGIAALNVPAAPQGAIDRTQGAEATVTVLDLDMGEDIDSVFVPGQNGGLALDRASRGYASGTVGIQ